MKNFIDWLFEDYIEHDDLPFAMTSQDVLAWVKSIHDNLLSQGKGKFEGKHHGDCTGHKASCQLCMYLIWLEDYKKYCESFKNK